MGVVAHTRQLAYNRVRSLAELSMWRGSAAADRRSALAESLDGMISILVEHMSLEESDALPMVERYVTAEEWQWMAEQARARVDEDLLTLALGMVMYGTFANSPPQPGSPQERMLQVYGSYSKLIHGTATPPRSPG
jgi:hypothetical protein